MKNQNTGLQAGIIQIDWQSFTTRQRLNLMLFKIFSYEQLRNDFNQNIKNLWSHFHCGRKNPNSRCLCWSFQPHLTVCIKGQEWILMFQHKCTLYIQPFSASVCEKTHQHPKSFISVLISVLYLTTEDDHEPFFVFLAGSSSSSSLHWD